jgi:hypothetical protein
VARAGVPPLVASPGPAKLKGDQPPEYVEAGP